MTARAAGVSAGGPLLVHRGDIQSDQTSVSPPDPLHTELQRLADETGLTIAVCHFPPGTSKWNKIEHRLFSYISMNVRGRPLTSHEIVVNLIANTTTAAGLKVQCRLDTADYPTGVAVTDEQIHDVQIERNDFHPEWNYRVRPRSRASG